MDQASKLTYLIQHLASVLSKQTDQLLREQLGIGLSQYRILLALDWNPRVQQQIIASALGQTPASISRQINLLEKKGLLISRQDQLNRRKHITLPTPLGMQMTEAAAEIIRRSFAAEWAKVGDSHLQQLVTDLQRLHMQVCQPGKTGACDHQLGF